MKMTHLKVTQRGFEQKLWTYFLHLCSFFVDVSFISFGKMLHQFHRGSRFFQGGRTHVDPSWKMLSPEA